MLITLPYLTIKHETRVPLSFSKSFRGEEKSSLAHQGESRRASNKTSRNVWACLGLLPAPCLAVHPLAKQARTPIDVTSSPLGSRYAKNQLHQEQVSSWTSINGPSVTRHEELQPTDSCEDLWGTVRNFEGLRGTVRCWGAVRSVRCWGTVRLSTAIRAAKLSPTITNSTVASSPTV